ncbi:MAG: M20 family metallopeptidase [Planctomycetota bacterium]|jgi:succinyl-diaminopimelate desuccinylase
MNNLLKHLIRTAPTEANGELNAANALMDYFNQAGLKAELDCWGDNRANVVAQIGSLTPDAPTLVFGVHLDVVPASAENWDTDPFTPVEEDGFLYGRGSVDMQGGICAAAAALVEIAQSDAPLNGRVIFAAAAGEETDSCGVKRFVEQYKDSITNPVGIVIPEPTGLEILRAHRGILWLKVETAGRTAHGSMPHLGINAILKMNAFLNRLADYQIPHTPHPLLGGCSMSINQIGGGSATNIVPESCAVELDIRTLPGQSHEEIIDSLKAICDELHAEDAEFNAKISIIRAVDALETEETNEFVQSACTATGINETKSAGFTTDGPYFAKLNAPVIIFGPGDGSQCHKPNEHLELAQLETAKNHYKSIITSMLG